MVKRIGIFGGSFDPIHTGHINLALGIAELKSLDKVLFCPAKVSPFKVDEPPRASYEDRCAMVERALEGMERFELSRVDQGSKGPTFMIDTLSKLKKEYQEDQFFLIIASDAYAHFDRWKHANEIKKIAPILVAPRPGSELDTHQEGAEFCDVPTMDVSSKNLRERLKKRLYCGHQIPSKVLDFIYQNRLYY